MAQFGRTNLVDHAASIISDKTDFDRCTDPVGIACVSAVGA
jgi:hypothetical protein